MKILSKHELKKISGGSEIWTVLLFFMLLNWMKQSNKKEKEEINIVNIIKLENDNELSISGLDVGPI